MSIKSYVNFITEQSKHGATLRSNTLNEEDSSVTAAVRKHKSPHDKTAGRDAEHVSSHGHEHVYSTNPVGRDTESYLVHNTQTKKTHEVHVSDGEKASHPHISPKVLKHITKHASGED
jgi:hypothetical protein